VYFNAGGNVATVVFAGSEPDEKTLDRLRARMPKWGLTVVCKPDPILPPEDGPT
jgi:hypothetical protein